MRFLDGVVIGVLDELKLIAVKSFGKDLKVFRLNYRYGFFNSKFCRLCLFEA